MPQKPFEHPAIGHLAATPEIMQALLTGISPEQAYWKPKPDRYSIAELLEHLSHVEAHCFRVRFDESLAQDDPAVEPYDQNAFYAQGAYSDRDAEESMAHWEEQRENNLEFLRGLESGALNLYGTAYRAWPVHARKTCSMNGHCTTLGHIRQMAELCTRMQPLLSRSSDRFRWNTD